MGMRTGRGDEDDLDESHEINVTPFIDVMLVLLIVFMIAAPLATVDTDVDLPESNAAAEPRDAQALFLTVAPDRSLQLDETPVAPEQLAAALDAASGGDRDRRIFLRADRAIDYGSVMAVMNRLRDAGYRHVALVGLEAAPAP
jgi:biopolymer transport protein ExbD